ncbi:MAG: hypothetical protein VKK62_04015 [Synechococcaceae cyanobacterium]|nr:hypothetical protein [Synechococcaceae cyanobacterium]
MRVRLLHDPTCAEQVRLARRLSRSVDGVSFQLLGDQGTGALPPSPPCDLILHLKAMAPGGRPAPSEASAPLQAWLGGFRHGRVQPLSAASGFAEVWHHDAATALAIVSPGPDGGWLCQLHAEIPTQRHWRHNREQLIEACADYAALWLRHAGGWGLPRARGRAVPCREIQAAPPPGWRRPPLWCRHQLERIGLKLHHLTHRHAHWRIGWSGPGQPPLAPSRQIPAPASTWYADPFAWRDETGHHWLLCEQFEEDGARLGRIALFELPDGGPPLAHGTVLEEPFHLSFPRLVWIGGVPHLTVESASQQEVRLYEPCPFPRRWRLRRILLQGCTFIDPMLFQHDDGLWYLLVSTSSTAALRREVAPELRLFHSPDPLTAPFREHPSSPLLISSRGGRNAGLLHRGGQWLRVAQRTGFGGIYGESVALFRIVELSPSSYREEPLATIPDGPSPGRLQRTLRASHLHTLNEAGPLLVYDFIHG